MQSNFVVWAVAFLAAGAAVFAAIIQGWFAIKGIRNQLKDAESREIRRDRELKGALTECLIVDLQIVEQRILNFRMEIEDMLRDGRKTSFDMAKIHVTIPDTIASSWQDLSRLDVENIKLVRKLSIELTSLRESNLGNIHSDSDRSNTLKASLNSARQIEDTVAKLRESIFASGILSEAFVVGKIASSPDSPSGDTSI